MSTELTSFYYYGSGTIGAQDKITLPIKLYKDFRPPFLTEPYSGNYIHVYLDTELGFPFLSTEVIDDKSVDEIELSRTVYPKHQMTFSKSLYEEFEQGKQFHFVSLEANVEDEDECHRVYILSPKELLDKLEERWRWASGQDRDRFVESNDRGDPYFDKIKDFKSVMEIKTEKGAFDEDQPLVEVEVLGCTQDGGVPHPGCNADICRSAFKQPEERKYASSLLIKGIGDEQENYLIQATPDIRFQLGPRAKSLGGIFISHGHIGHVAGLLILSNEVLNAKEIDLYCTNKLREYLFEGGPFQTLVKRDDRDNQHLIINEISESGYDDVEIGSCTFSAVKVQEPHGYTGTDNHAFYIEGPRNDLFFAPVIDEWTKKLVNRVKAADTAIVDGTFWKEGEDAPFDVGHPPIKETMDRMEEFDTRIMFTNLNHTNPVLDSDSEARRQMDKREFEIAERGLEIEI